MAEGWCTLEDVRRALRTAQLPGDVSQDSDIAADKIEAQTEPLEKALNRHWYAEKGDQVLTEANAVTVPTEPLTRDDEHDIQRHGGLVHGASESDRHRRNTDSLLESGPRHERRRKHPRQPKEEIRVAIGSARDVEHPRDSTGPTYTRIQLDRKDVDTFNELLVIGSDGTYTDWVASNDYDGGVGLTNRGKDYWVRLNNGGVSELYLNIHSLDDDISSLSNAVYVDYDYGRAGIPQNVRQGVANLVAAELVEEAVIEIPQNATLYNIETKATELRTTAYDQYLSTYAPEGTEFRGGER